MSRRCQSVLVEIFHFTEIRFCRMCRPSRLIQEGRPCVVTVASRACGGRGSVGTRGAGRAGSPCEPEASCGRAALRGFVSSVSFRLRRRGLGKLRRNGGPCVRQNRVVLAVVATVKLLRRCARAQPGERHCQFAGRGRPEGIRLPGEHGISRPTIAQGRPSDWHHLYAAVRFFLRVHFAQRTAGARSAPGLPCALLALRGWSDQAKLGRNLPRECAAMSARSVEPLRTPSCFGVDESVMGFASLPILRAGRTPPPPHTRNDRERPCVITPIGHEMAMPPAPPLRADNTLRSRPGVPIKYSAIAPSGADGLALVNPLQ